MSSTHRDKSVNSKNADSTSTITDSSRSSSQEAVEDKRLMNWRRWLSTHKRIANRLRLLTDRKPEDLLINSHEKARHKVAIHNLLETIAESDLSEQLTNDLSFWVLPEYLKNRRDPQHPEIAVSLTRKQLRIPRNDSRVFLPEVSQREKLLSLPKPSEPTQNEYLSRRLKDLSPKISQLNLKTSDIDRVAIRGREIPERKKVTLKFQDHEVIFEGLQPKTEETPPNFSLDFFTRCEVAAEEKICLENKTFAKVIYEWQEVVLDTSVRKLEKSGVFHFGKNSDLVLPGRCAEIIVWYRPKSPGAHLESFRLDTTPRITTSDVIFRLWGVCEEPNRCNDVIADFDDYLRIRFRNSAVGEIVEDLWERVESPRPQLPPYALYFLESEVFEAKNPHFFHRCEVVEELKSLFLRVAQRDPWGLSLCELQRHLVAVEDANVRDGMLKRFAELTQELAKPSGRFSTNSKHEVVYNLLCKFANHFFQESRLVKSLCIKSARCGAESYLWLDSVSQEFESKLMEQSRFWREVGRSSQSSSADFLSEEGECRQQTEDDDGVYDVSLYFEVFYIRIYELLVGTVDEISAAIDSVSFLS